MEIQVSKNQVVYALIELSNGKKYSYFPQTGKTGLGTIIETLSAYSLRGPVIISGYGPDGKIYGLSTEAFVTIQEVLFRDADSTILNLTGNTYTETDFPQSNGE